MGPGSRSCVRHSSFHASIRLARFGFGDDKKAMEMLDNALAINPVGIDPNYFLGDMLYRTGDYEGARKA